MVINIHTDTGKDLLIIKDEVINHMGIKRISFDAVISILIKSYKESK